MLLLKALFLTANTDSLERALKDSKAMVATLYKSISDLESKKQAELDKKDAELADQSEKYKNSLEAVIADRARLQEQLDTQGGENTKLQAKIAEYEVAIANLEIRLAQVEAEKADLFKQHKKDLEKQQKTFDKAKDAAEQQKQRIVRKTERCTS